MNYTIFPKNPKTPSQKQAKIIAEALRRGMLVIPSGDGQVLSSRRASETLAQMVEHYGTILANRKGRKPQNLAGLADALQEIMSEDHPTFIAKK